MTTVIERSVKQLYPLELRVGTTASESDNLQLTADEVQQDGARVVTEVMEVTDRPKRLAKSKAADAIKSMAAEESDV